MKAARLSFRLHSPESGLAADARRIGLREYKIHRFIFSSAGDSVFRQGRVVALSAFGPNREAKTYQSGVGAAFSYGTCACEFSSITKAV